MTDKLNRALQERGYFVAASEERCPIGDVWNNWTFRGTRGEYPLVVIGDSTAEEAAEFAALYGAEPPTETTMHFYRVTTE